MDDQKKLKSVNGMISRAMQYICNLERRNTKNLIEPIQSKLYFFRWVFMMTGFQQDLISVWEIKCDGGRHAVVVTLKGVEPDIKNLENMINIKSCTADTPDLSLFSKMLLLKVDGDRTKCLSLVLYGGPNFWRITGFANSNIDYIDNGVAARPTPETHPHLSLKINQFFNILNARPKKRKSIEQNVDQDSETHSKKVRYETNITTFPTDSDTLKSLFLPIPQIGEHRWFMLQLTNDFSDIYIPAWNSYLTYDKIAYALSLAKKHCKTVRVTINEKFPEIYATPNHSNRIFFGPYRLDEEIDYVLCQNFDGELITREEYQERLGIKRNKATKGSWLYLKGETKKEENENLSEPKPSTSTESDIEKSITKPHSPLPLVISSVQTITDPKFFPIDDDQCDDANEISIVPTKRKSEERTFADVNNSVVIKKVKIEDGPSNGLKCVTKPNLQIARKLPDVVNKPIKLTLCRQKDGNKGDAYEIKMMSVTGNSPRKIKADITLTGRRITLPLSAVKQMKQIPAMISNNLKTPSPLSLLKNPINAPPAKIDGTNNPEKPSISLLPKLVPILPKATDDYTKKAPMLQKVLLKSALQSIREKCPNTVIRKKSLIKIKHKVPSPVPEICKKLPSAITVISLPSSTSTTNTPPSTSTTLKTITPKMDVFKEPSPMKISTTITTTRLSIPNSTNSPLVTIIKENQTLMGKQSSSLEPIKGYYVSKCNTLGRITAEKFDKAIVLTMKNAIGILVKRNFVDEITAISYLNR